MRRLIIKLLMCLIVIVIISIIMKWDYLGKRPEKIKYQNKIYQKIYSYKEYDLYEFIKNLDEEVIEYVCIESGIILDTGELRYIDDTCYGTYFIGYNGEIYETLDMLESQLITIQELLKLTYPIKILKKTPRYITIIENCEVNTPCEPTIVKHVLDGYEWIEIE